MKAGKKMARKR